MKRFATTAVWLLALTPGLVALFALGEGSWRSPVAGFYSLGRLTGVWGLSFMLTAAILSARVPGVDVVFGGLTKLWRTHHLLASWSFLLLLAHPLLLALGNAQGDVGIAVAALFPPTDAWEVWLGWGALVTLMIFLAPSFSFFGEPDYQRWKHLHRLAAVAVILALVHAYYLGRAIPHPWDYWLWSLMAALAVGALGYRFLFSRFQFLLFQGKSKGGRLPYEVLAVDQVANNVVELSLRPILSALNYNPGQFVYLTPYDKSLIKGYGQEHPYTISSAPGEDRMRITIKDLGDASRAMQHIKAGSEVRIEGPYGAFFPATDAKDAELWIAGGIGITPFLSRARYLLEQAEEMEEEVDIHLIYCVQDESRALFAQEFSAIAGQLPGFYFHPHYFYREGPLNEAFIRQCCRNYIHRGVYICGPLPLLQHLQRVLSEVGVPRHRIETEEFNLL